MLKIISLASGLLAFLAVIWIVVPAPAYFVWLFSVAASEWSLWLSVLALVAIVFGILAACYGGGGKILTASFIISGFALVISLYPLLSVIKLAAEHNVSLSIVEYFSGLKSDNQSSESFTTRTYANIDDKTQLQFDVYPPTIKNDNNGASVVVIHGGSWSGGVRNDFPQWNRWLAAEGFTVFDIDYRLAPQPNYLSATGDVKCALRYIKSHAPEFDISPDRIALFGRSAGAHLALLAGYSAGDNRLPASCTENPQNENVRAVISFYAPVEMVWAFDNPANPRVIDGAQTIGSFLGGNPHVSADIFERFTLATPSAHVSAATPPTFLVHGGKDQLVREENLRFLDAKLNENGISHQTLFIQYAQHGFDYNIHGWGSQITKPLLLDFLRDNTIANPR